MPLTSHELRAIIAHQMLSRDVDTMTVTREELDGMVQNCSLTVTELEGRYVFVADDADTDLEPSDQFPTTP